jgi:hypothetical protein
MKEIMGHIQYKYRTFTNAMYYCYKKFLESVDMYTNVNSTK